MKGLRKRVTGDKNTRIRDHLFHRRRAAAEGRAVFLAGIAAPRLTEEGPTSEAGGTAGTLAVTIRSMGADGTFEVMLKRDALVDDLVVAIGESRGIANARQAVAVFVAGDEDPLSGTQPVAARMADAGASELFMLLRECNRFNDTAEGDVDVLLSILGAVKGLSKLAGWKGFFSSLAKHRDASKCWGVTLNADRRVCRLDLSNKGLSGPWWPVHIS